jgi:hypothetical protein
MVPLERISSTLVHLRDNTGLDLQRVPAPKPLAHPACEVVGPRWCSGPIQHAHFFAQEDHAHHALLHHPDNIFSICRSHHRRIDQRRTGYDFAGPALRMSEPPGRRGRLSLNYVFWVIANVKPVLWEKALKVGIMLEARIGERQIIGKNASLPISLYHLWLYEHVGSPAGIRSLKGVIYEYEESDYRPPGPNGEAGDCRTYWVKAEVVQRIQAGPYLELHGEGLRYVLAFILRRQGHTLNLISSKLQRHQERRRKASTVSGWVERGQALIEKVINPRDIAWDEFETKRVEGLVSALGVDFEARVDARGKVTIPAAKRREVGIRFGDVVRLQILRRSD